MNSMLACANRAAAGAAALLLCGSAWTAAAQPQPPIMQALTHEGLCAEVQRYLAGTAKVARNIVHTDYESFVKSKPSASPFETQQYVMYESGMQRPLRVSCKTKTADHLKEVYGAGTADGVRRSCRDVNRGLVLAAFAAMTPAERGRVKFRPSRVMLDGDDRVVGPGFVRPYAFAYEGTDAMPHLRARELYVTWSDWRWKIAPERFRGTHYCHLVAPEYARRIMLGEIQLEPKS
jgi:hypothetical protein